MCIYMRLYVCMFFLLFHRTSNELSMRVHDLIGCIVYICSHTKRLVCVDLCLTRTYENICSITPILNYIFLLHFNLLNLLSVAICAHMFVCLYFPICMYFYTYICCIIEFQSVFCMPELYAL